MPHFIHKFIAVILLVGAGQLRAEKLQLGDFPVSEKRMAELIERAANGDLELPDGFRQDSYSTADTQAGILFSIMQSREKAATFSFDSKNPSDYLYQAIKRARKGEMNSAGNLLEKAYELYDGHSRDQMNLYFSGTYWGWNGRLLTYRFLCWWRDHVSESLFLSLMMLAVAAQFLALPLVVKLRQAILEQRRGWALMGPALAVLYVELVPLCWAVATGHAWAFAFDDHRQGAGPVAYLAIVITFASSSGNMMPTRARVAVVFHLLLWGCFLVLLPMSLIQDCFDISDAAYRIGCAFLAGTLSAALYIFLLIWRARPGLSAVATRIGQSFKHAFDSAR